jgi:crotonobetainyl-CoA:carnitine CoA-transferase CaiB-like acyl-CoA transferase
MLFRDISTGLEGLKVVDLGYGLSGGIAAKLLGELGAQVSRFELNCDPFREMYPTYEAWHARSEITYVESFDDPVIAAALREATVCLLGGEDHPALPPRLDADTIARDYPAILVVAIEGYPAASFAEAGPATELLVQARSGLSYEQFSDRPFFRAFSPANYCAAVHAVAGTLAALCARARGSTTKVVRTSLYEGALTLAAQFWVTAEQPVSNFYKGVPKDPRQIIVRGSDGRYVHIVLGSAGSKGSLYRVLGINDPSVLPTDNGVPTGTEEPHLFFGDVDLLAHHAAQFHSDTLMTELNAAGVPASFVGAPGECWSDPQVNALGIIETDIRGCRYVGRTLRGRLTQTSATIPDRLKTDGPPLAGVRVLDFGMFVAGPCASVPLADLGADVIKIETLQGDPSYGIKTVYASVNRGKRSIVIDLKSADGQDICKRLVASADVVYNNFRPKVSKRLGLDPDTLLASDPEKIVLESTGFGRIGPNIDRPGFDMILQGYTGHEFRAGGVGNDPCWDRTTMIDWATGLLSEVGLLTALWRRMNGQGGADIDTSLLDGGLFLMSDLIQAADGTMQGNMTVEADLTGFHPASSLYQMRDGWMAIDAVDDAMAGRLAALVGVTVRHRAKWDDIERQAIRQWAATCDCTDAATALTEAHVWAEMCETNGGDALRRAGAPAGMLATWPHSIFGAVTQIPALFRLDGMRPKALRGVATSGEHTREILVSLGYMADEIDGFYAQRVVA